MARWWPSSCSLFCHLSSVLKWFRTKPAQGSEWQQVKTLEYTCSSSAWLLCSHTGSLLFQAHARQTPTLRHFLQLFLVPGMLLIQMSAWLNALPTSIFAQTWLSDCGWTTSCYLIIWCPQRRNPKTQETFYPASLLLSPNIPYTFLNV